MSKKTILILGIAFMAVTLVFNLFFQTFVGDLLMTLSFIAFLVVVIGTVYYVIQFSIKLFIYNRKNRNDT